MPGSTSYRPKPSSPLRPAGIINKVVEANKLLVPDIAQRLQLMDVYSPIKELKASADVFSLAYSYWLSHMDEATTPVVGYRINKKTLELQPWVFLRDDNSAFKCVEFYKIDKDCLYMGVPVPDSYAPKGRFVFNMILSNLSTIRALSPRELEGRP